MPTSSDTCRVVVTMPRDEYERLAEWLRREDKSISAYIRSATQARALADGLRVNLEIKHGGDRRPDARD